MKDESGLDISSLKVDGGASANNFLMQFQSDISDLKIERPSCVETTALGAAYLAGLAVSYWADKDEIKKNWQMQKEFLPQIPADKRNKLLKGWRRAVKCALCWAEGDDTDE